MAKGQKKSNREAKKPNKTDSDRAKEAAGAGLNIPMPGQRALPKMGALGRFVSYRHGGRRPATHDFPVTSIASRGWSAFADHDGLGRPRPAN